MSLDKLIFLVNEKNDVNRRRRRFGYHARKSTTIREMAKNWTSYCDAQDEMKTMTPTISALRKELGAKLVWNNGGMITSIYTNDMHIHYKEYKRYVMSYLAERELLGE